MGAAPNLGVFLRELEDQMEVARIQQKVTIVAASRSCLVQGFAPLLTLFSHFLDFGCCYKSEVSTSSTRSCHNCDCETEHIPL